MHLQAFGVAFASLWESSICVHLSSLFHGQFLIWFSKCNCVASIQAIVSEHHKKSALSLIKIYIFFLLIDNKTVEKKRRIEWKAHQEESRTNEEMCNLGELWSKLHTTFQQKCDIEPRIRHQKIWSISANLIAFDVKMDAINIIRFATVAQLLRKCRRKSFATIFVPFSLLFFFSFDFHFDKILLVC